MMCYPAAAQWYLLYSLHPSCTCQVDQDHYSVNPSSQQHTSDRESGTAYALSTLDKTQMSATR
ncbi:unnamed protein product [Brugia timori]|uniref:Secreted protein n=1 Tax=Brugia timori TaxID=42155 RepID=A0A0R3QX25_9BILA|nr:unnamed protein product [Brugia timori]